MSHPLPANPMTSGRSPSPSKGDRSGFSRSGFAPIPHRHADLSPIPPPRDRERDDWERREPMPDTLPPLPRRDGPPDPEWDRRPDYDRRRGGPPPWEDDYDRPKRRRSPSPSYPSNRQRLRSNSPPSRYHSGSNLPDPAEVEHLLTFKQFADWFRASHPQTAKADEEEVRRYKEAINNGQSDNISKEKVGMSKRYERYRKEYTSRQLYALYLTHRASPWFQERYSQEPKFVAQRRRVNRQGRVPTAEKYLDALRTGEYDNVSFDMPEGGGEKSSARRTSELEEPEGLDRALGDTSTSVDDPLRVEVAPGERQVFVKTVPPSTTRKDLEDLFNSVEGFQYLAITEPVVKKSFHRVAWAQYAEGVDLEEVVKKLDGSKLDNFTFHMAVNATPIAGRTRITAPLSNTLERLQIDAEKAHDLAYKLEDELLGDDEETQNSDAENGGEGASSQEKKMPGLREKGTTVVQDRIDRILEDQGLIGDSLDAEQQLKRAKLIADHWISYLRHGLSTCYYCVAPTAFREELHRKCISHMRPHPAEESLEAIPEGEASADVVAGDREEKDEKDTIEEPATRGDGEDDDDRREIENEDKPDENKTKEFKKTAFPKPSSDDKWEESLDTKIKPLLQTVDVIEYGGRDPEEETRKLCAPVIKQEEASKYRCKECNKLFRAAEFVIKHITVKHPELAEVKTDEINVLNAFVLDPQKIQPTVQTPAAVNDRIMSLQNSIAQQPFFNPNFQNGQMGFAGGMQNGQNGGGQFNMVQQQMMMMMQMQQAMMMNQMSGGRQNQGEPGGDAGATGLAQRMGGFAGPSPTPLPPPPPGGEDPRARRGRVSYMDLDAPGGGSDGGLPY